jgi:hypothetical protein
MFAAKRAAARLERERFLAKADAEDGGDSTNEAALVLRDAARLSNIGTQVRNAPERSSALTPDTCACDMTSDNLLMSVPPRSCRGAPRGYARRTNLARKRAGGGQAASAGRRRVT